MNFPVLWRVRFPLVALLLGFCFLFDSGVLHARSTSQIRYIEAAGYEIKVFIYRPVSCRQLDILFVFHGLNRKAENARKYAMPLADSACLMVFAPLFDKERFPNWRYHRAGVVRKGKLEPESGWTHHVVRDLVETARVLSGRAHAKVYLYGHSAGGQFLSRLFAYADVTAAERIIIANPSVYVQPSQEEPVPYGYAGVLSEEQRSERLREYLALPITIYLGTEDVGSQYLVDNEAAMRQGQHRLERGRNVYTRAQAAAAAENWAFAWKLVEAEGVGHSSKGMLRSSAMPEAMGR